MDTTIDGAHGSPAAEGLPFRERGKWVFQGRKLTVLQIRGLLCWIAAEISLALEYSRGSKLGNLIRDEWREHFAEGVDFICIEGEDLVELKAVLRGVELDDGEDTADAPERSVNPATGSTLESSQAVVDGLKFSRSLLLLTESGVHMATLLSRKPKGVQLRRVLAQQVLPQLARDGAYLPERRVGSNGRLTWSERQHAWLTQKAAEQQRLAERERRLALRVEADLERERRRLVHEQRLLEEARAKAEREQRQAALALEESRARSFGVLAKAARQCRGKSGAVARAFLVASARQVFGDEFVAAIEDEVQAAPAAVDELEQARRRSLLRALRLVCTDAPVTSAQIAGAARAAPGGALAAALTAALQIDVAGDDFAGRLGYALRSLSGLVVDGLSLEKDGVTQGRTRWVVRSVS